MIAVADPADPRLHEYTGLTDVSLRRRREPAEGLFMAESLPVLQRALAAGYRPRSVLSGPRWREETQQVLGAVLSAAELEALPYYEGTDDVVAATTGFRMHRGPMAAMGRRPLPAPGSVLAGARLVLVLAGLVDHTNVGAAFRSAAALGVGAVLVSQDCADPLYRRSVRVSMGAVFDVPWTRTADWAHDLTAWTTVALTPDPAAQPLPDVARRLRGEPVALVVGTEGPGLPAAAQRSADLRARIPMAHGVDSLNVAAAVAVAVYALAG